MNTLQEETVVLHGEPIRLVGSPDVFRLLRERGGDLYVWMRTHGCCIGALVMLEADTDRPASDHRFEHAPGDGFDLFIDLAGRQAPRTLALELRGRRRKIVAYWNGVAYVV